MFLIKSERISSRFEWINAKCTLFERMFWCISKRLTLFWSNCARNDAAFNNFYFQFASNFGIPALNCLENSQIAFDFIAHNNCLDSKQQKWIVSCKRYGIVCALHIMFHIHQRGLTLYWIQFQTIIDSIDWPT